MRIAEMTSDELTKRILTVLATPKTIAQVAAKLDISYTTASQRLSVLEAKGWIFRDKSMTGKTFFKLNHQELQI